MEVEEEYELAALSERKTELQKDNASERQRIAALEQVPARGVLVAHRILSMFFFHLSSITSGMNRRSA